jgi:hypothetical protein
MPALQQAELNTWIDVFYRGQVPPSISNHYLGLLIVMPTRSSAGTEASTGAGYTGYARLTVAASLANFSGTQSDGSTTASSGTRDYITNNIALTWSSSLTAAWNNVVAVGNYSASSGGVLREWYSITDSDGNPITMSRSIGQPFSMPAGYLRLYRR